MAIIAASEHRLVNVRLKMDSHNIHAYTTTERALFAAAVTAAAAADAEK